MNHKQELVRKKEMLQKFGLPAFLMEESHLVTLNYNEPLELQDMYTAKCKTTQTISVLVIKNLSATLNLTVFIEPSPGNTELYVIKANDPTPLWLKHQWNGAILTVSNVSANGGKATIFIS